jgi:hypothetical protein
MNYILFPGICCFYVSIARALEGAPTLFSHFVASNLILSLEQQDDAP